MFPSLIIFRDGESLSGKILDERFAISTNFGTISVKTEQIVWMHFRNPPLQDKDELWNIRGDRLRGVIKNLKGKFEQWSVTFESASGDRLVIPFEQIHTVIANQAFDPTKGWPK